MRLSCMGRTTSQKDIASALGVSPACVARTLKSLSAAGLIDKAEGSDSRRREIAILPAGQRLVDDSIKTFEAIGAEMFDGIGEEELSRFCETLDRLYQNLCRMENPEGVKRP